MAPGLLIESSCAESPTCSSRELEVAKAEDARFSVFEHLQSWPKTLASDLAWDASGFKSEDDYTLTLTKQHETEIEDALHFFKSCGLDGHEVTRDTFPLPTLAPKLLLAAVEVHSGKGFIVIRGLNPDHVSLEDNTIVFLGVSSYIGENRAKQDEDGNMLMHICNAKRSKEAQSDRPTRFSNRASTFHTDTFCDIIALQTRGCAASGGNHIVASAWTVYNKIAAMRPQVLNVLARPDWPFDSRGILFDRNTRSLLHYHGGHLILNFAREPLVGLNGVARTTNFPEISKEQREALDCIEDIARDSQLTLSTRLGDLVFINNHALLHSREAFEDSAGASRYLVRMWLRSRHLAWKLPRQLQIGNHRIYDDIQLEERWNIIAEPKLRFKLSERLCS